jgi:BirA family biotin operon repressor/biotin-[acetyl-CoA-carboxylase] ligase
VGLALFNSIRQTWPTLSASLKAPNDLFIADKKVAGILVETITQGIHSQIVIGLGFNVFSHPVEMLSACHLKEFTGDLQQETWVKFCNCFLGQLLNYIELAQRPLLDKASCQALLKALNSFPHLPEPYIDVTPDGSLITGSGQIHWSKL